MKIFTSIAPRKTDTQRLAIESWIENGFQPVSMNSAAEIERLAPLFPEVKFIRAHRDATELAGKPLIYIDDLLEAMAASGDKVCGLVNSDIIFRSHRNLPEWFHYAAVDGLVYGSRMDVDQPGDTAGEIYQVGFDYFFMDAVTAAGYPPTALSMGAPMWDYWAPLVAILRGRNCGKVDEVFAYHVRHEAEWDNTFNIRMMKEIIDHSGIEFEGIEGVDFSTLNSASGTVLHQFAQFILSFLASHSKPVT